MVGSGFSPLAGIKSVERSPVIHWYERDRGFSPLAGIKSVERLNDELERVNRIVSVPLRGLSQWKVIPPTKHAITLLIQVSVPLRGLSQWKVQSLFLLPRCVH